MKVKVVKKIYKVQNKLPFVDLRRYIFEANNEGKLTDEVVFMFH